MALFGIDLESLRLTLQEASLAGVGLGFLVGFVFSLNPVSLDSVPVALAFVTKSPTRNQANVLTGTFIAGLMVAHAALGVAAALGMSWLKLLIRLRHAQKSLEVLAGVALMFTGSYPLWNNLINHH